METRRRCPHGRPDARGNEQSRDRQRRCGKRHHYRPERRQRRRYRRLCLTPPAAHNHDIDGGDAERRALHALQRRADRLGSLQADRGEQDRRPHAHAQQDGAFEPHARNLERVTARYKTRRGSHYSMVTPATRHDPLSRANETVSTASALLAKLVRNLTTS